MATPLKLSDLKLKHATMEIRYNDAFLIWDNAGLIWSRISSKFNDLKMIKAEPMVTSFKVDDHFELAVKLDRAHLIDLKPNSNLKEFIETSEVFINLVAKSLEITEFTRVGFRLIYIKQFPDRIAAANSVLSTKIMTVPDGKHFNIEGKTLLPKYSIIWEGESTAVRVTLGSQDKTISLDVHPDIEEISSMEMLKYEVIYDLDYYTLHPISKGQLNLKEWLTQAYHLIKRDSKVFFGE